MNTAKREFNRVLMQWKNATSLLPNIGPGLFRKVDTCTIVYLAFEAMAFEKGKKDPFVYMQAILQSEIASITMISKAFSDPASLAMQNRKKQSVESRHKTLFNNLWDKYNVKEYRELMELAKKRFVSNHLGKEIKNKTCLDIGCGGGRHCVALAKLGAASVTGVDYGTRSIIFAEEMKRRLKVSSIQYRVANAYRLPFKDRSFDIAVSNGVFHHLEDMPKALAETFRVLKPGGWFWLYIIGTGGMINQLCDATKYIMRDVKCENVYDILRHLGFNDHKTYTLLDNFYATYFYTSWQALVQTLQKIGFKDIRRIAGKNQKDYDQLRSGDSRRQILFGEGEIRLLAYK